MSQQSTHKILFIAQLPPPVHGSATISKIFVDSTSLNTAFNLKVIPLHFSKHMSDIGSFSGTKVIKTFRYAFEIFQTIRNFKPDVVYFTLAPIGLSFYRDVFYVSILKMSGVRIVYHLHVHGIRKESKQIFKELLYKFVFRRTYVITLSKLLESDLSAVYQERPFIVNNGIPVVLAKAPLAKNPASAKAHLLYLSNFARSKGVFVLLKALSRLHKKGAHFTATIVGKAADVTREEIEEYVAANSLSEIVRVEDAKYGDEKHAAFMGADIFVHPTLNDAFPLVILEAMQFQLPVISTFEGAIPEIVDHERTGLLTTKGDDYDLHLKIEHLISNPGTRQSMGRAGRDKFLSSYTSEVMVENLREVLDQICRLP